MSKIAVSRSPAARTGSIGSSVPELRQISLYRGPGGHRGGRRRQLGRALLREAFAELRQRGLPRAYLGVDSENPTGAMGLYESVGMSPKRGAHLVFEKDLPGG